MNLFGKIGDLARNIGDKATEAIETTKLNSKINAEKNEIAECLRGIGAIYYGKHQAGEATDGEIAELLSSIDGHNKIIEETQAEIARIQEESAALAASAEGDGGAQSVKCAACGEENPIGTKFCAECGEKLEPPAAEKPCPSCGAQVSAAGKFCGACGYRFEE